MLEKVMDNPGKENVHEWNHLKNQILKMMVMEINKTLEEKDKEDRQKEKKEKKKEKNKRKEKMETEGKKVSMIRKQKSLKDVAEVKLQRKHLRKNGRALQKEDLRDL